MKRGAVNGFQVPSGVVVFDTVIDKAISRGVKKHFFSLMFIMTFLVSVS